MSSPEHQEGEREEEKQQQQEKKRVKKHNRGAIFRKFIVETFLSSSSSSPSLSSSSYFILDVAGGSGDLAVPLFLAGFTNTIVVDPRKCDFEKNRTMKNLFYHLEESKKGNRTKTFQALEEKIGKENLESGFKFPKQLNELFLFPPSSCASSSSSSESKKQEQEQEEQEKEGEKQNQKKKKKKEHQEQLTGESEELREAKEKCSVVVGLHPDEATEPIVDFALAERIPFAVIPCCVFPRDNPHRRLKSGRKVETYEHFLQYLYEKDPERIQVTKLDFEGRNTCLFAKF